MAKRPWAEAAARKKEPYLHQTSKYPGATQRWTRATTKESAAAA
jgi:hypothetical protein